MKLKPPSNFRKETPKCCATCKYYNVQYGFIAENYTGTLEFEGEQSCNRDKHGEISKLSNSAPSEMLQWMYVCDGYKLPD